MLQHLENALWRIIQKLIHKRVQSHPQDNFEHIIILPLLQSINSNTSIDALTCLIPGKLDLHKCSTMGISTKVGETWWKPKISIYNSTLLHQLFNMCFYCFGSHNNPKALTAFVDSHASEAAQDNEKKRKRKRRRVINWALLKGIGKAIPRHHEFWKVPKAPVSGQPLCMISNQADLQNEDAFPGQPKGHNSERVQMGTFRVTVYPTLATVVHRPGSHACGQP